MLKVLAHLPAWLRGPAHRKSEAFSSLKAQLNRQDSGQKTRPAPYTCQQGRETWDGTVIEIRLHGGLHGLHELTSQLSTFLPVPWEVSVLTHTEPKELVESSQSEADTLAGRVDSLLQPMQSACSFRTYLLVRTSSRLGRMAWFDALLDELFRRNIPLQVLEGPAAAELLHHYRFGNLTGPSQGWCSIVGEPSGGARHPQQHWGFNGLDSLETWECVTFLAISKPAQIIHVETTALVRGDSFASTKVLSKKEHQMLGLGIRPGHRLQGKASEPFPAVPWLRPVAKANKAGRNELATSSAEMARMLPIPAGAPRGFLPHGRETALRALNHRGAEVHLHASHLHGNMLVLGVEGAGLTYLGHAITAAHLRGGGQAWRLHWQISPVFDDVTGSYTISPSPERPVSINPLHGLDTESAYFAVRDVLREWLRVLAGLPQHPEIHISHLLAGALDTAWERTKGNLELTYVLAELAHSSPAGCALASDIRQRLEGVPMALFKGANPVTADHRHIGINFSAFKGERPREILASTAVALYAATAARLPRMMSKLLLVDETSVLESAECAKLLESALRSMPRHNAAAVFCGRPFDAEPLKQTASQRVLDCYCTHKLLMQGHERGGWNQRAAAVVDNAGAFVRSTHTYSRFVSLRENEGAGALLELVLSREAQVAFAPDRRQQAAYKTARASGMSVIDALSQAAREDSL